MAVALGAGAAGLSTPSRQAPPLRLPRLREDIRLHEGPPGRDGAPTWTLYDPALHRFVRIGRLEFEVLCRWGLGSPDRIAAAVAAMLPMPVTAEDVMDVVRFAERARLLHPEGGQAGGRLAREAAARRLSPALWLLKNYLFIRVRVLNPDRMLGWLHDLLRWMFTPAFALALAGLALTGLYLVGRQWDTFTHALMPLLSLDGLAKIAVALAFAKAVHEVGHGLMARHFGCRVPAMGVALLVLWPMLWTDVTDAWRLTRRHQRLLIDAAGILAELTLAVAATFAWCVLPDGAARMAALMLASSTWLLTVAVNLNPLMRFDGYFLLSDFLDVPNLQDRSFALARWRLRELLFGLCDPPPELMPASRRRLLICYAVCCWVYRFVLFMGIALLVYHLAFKLLGLFLMAVEVGWFIARPILNEVRVWPGRLVARGWPRRGFLTMGLFVAALVALALPWQGSVTAPARLRAERQMDVVTGEGGRLVVALPNGAPVAANQVIARLESPDLTHQRDAARAEIEGLRARLAGVSFDAEAHQEMALIWQQLDGALARLRDAEARSERLVVRAPFAGVMIDVPRTLAVGSWMPKRERLGGLIDPTRPIVEALVNEAEVGRLRPGANAVFLPENNEAPVRLIVQTVSPGAAPLLEAPELASVFGGGIAARKDAEGRLKPDSAVYRVVLRLADDQSAPALLARRGMVRMVADRRSPADLLWRRAVAVLMRETGL